ncbi:unnamed protein product [Adineta steineri]|uniref:RING-type domain-containing protein n=1 Tax=Adineta steineri TaxID=433720 RepID=A0A819CG47_9BILA|nr:unnamed protein product [Adineta steineri]CAF3820196.1 unnamed protein product [Adineta steineri]
MDDSWSRCPVCFEDYSLLHRPTTFVCGHSTCIDHTSGLNRLRECPICRYPLNQQHEYNVSYSLEEASCLYRSIKNTAGYSTIEFPSEHIGSNHIKIMNPDDIYARQLQEKFNYEIQNEHVEERPTTILALIFAVISSQQKSQHIGQKKECGHGCFLTTTSQCCSCSDRRPHSEYKGYEKYVDGRGIQRTGQRNQDYCPSCKTN